VRSASIAARVAALVFGWNTISCCRSVVAKMDTAFDMKKVAEKFLAATRHTSPATVVGGFMVLALN
jgi:hypothetical protein